MMDKQYERALAFTIFAIAFALIILLSGCSQVPSFQYCDDVSYVRKGNDIEVHAHCKAPVGGTAGQAVGRLL